MRACRSDWRCAEMRYGVSGPTGRDMGEAYVLFYTTTRVGGGVQDFDAIKV